MTPDPRIAPRDLPPYIRHPSHYDQPTGEDSLRLDKRFIEAYPSRCSGHVGTRVHYHSDGEGLRRYLVEVELQSGVYWIEAPCTYLPAMGMDLLDGHLVLDAEEWVLVQRLRLKPRRLAYMFGAADRQETGEYIRRALAPHAGDRFQDVEPEFEAGPADPLTATGHTGREGARKWWQFWK